MPGVALSVVLLLAAGAPAATVDAGRHDAFWVWGGVAPQPVLAHARTVYVLQGEIGVPPGDTEVALVAQGPAVARLGDRDVWLVYRARTLRWTPAVYATLLAQRARRLRAGDRVVGVQIDFDAATAHLDEYAAFLHDLRGRLPPECALGATGLLDWTGNGDANALDALTSVVDELVVQTYQGRRTVAGYERYLAALRRLHVPFRIGLVQGGEWTAPAFLSTLPWFRGYVVFLQNAAARGESTIP